MKTLKLTKSESNKLQSQFKFGSDLTKQNAVVKVFNPYGRGTWFLVNQDPEDLNYIWAIVDLGMGIEVGTVSLQAMMDVRVSVYGMRLPLEKDSSFDPKNASSVVEGLMEGKYFRDGGEIKVKVIEDDLSKKSYQAIYGDLDKDGVPDIDDKAPKNPKIKDTVEQVKLQEVFDQILDTKRKMKIKMDETIQDLIKIAPTDSIIYARTKTPYAIMNKLVNTKMYNMNPVREGDVQGLTDLVGTSIVVNNVNEIKETAAKLDKGVLGRVMERKDYYEKPKDGYMAVHYIIESNNVPVEVQLKTKRQKQLNEFSHNPYKFRNLNSQRLLSLSELVDKADRGDAKSIRDFDLLVADPEKLELSLYADKKRLNKLPS